MAPAILWQPEEEGIPASIWEPGGPEEVAGAFCELAMFDDLSIISSIISGYTLGATFPDTLADIDGELVEYLFTGDPAITWSGSAEVIDGALVVPTAPLTLSEPFGPVEDLGPYAIVKVGFSSFAEEDFEASITIESANVSHTIIFTQSSGGFAVQSQIEAEGTDLHGSTSGLDICAWHELEIIVTPGEVVMTIDGGDPTINDTTVHAYPADEALSVSIVSDTAGALRLSYLLVSTLPPA